MDNLTRLERSQQMSLVRSKNTKPELLVRRLVHRMGYRYRLHKADLPGRPDLVFHSQRKVVFIHGCFWHGHKCKLGWMQLEGESPDNRQPNPRSPEGRWEAPPQLPMEL